MTLSGGFRLGDRHVLPLEGRSVRESDGESRRVRRMATDVLCAPASRNGQVAERDDLPGQVWGRAVSDEPLTSTIGELRRLLDEKASRRQYIGTISERGSRLCVAVDPLADAASASVTAAAPDAVPVARLRPRARFDRRTAMAVVAREDMPAALLEGTFRPIAAQPGSAG